MHEVDVLRLLDECFDRFEGVFEEVYFLSFRSQYQKIFIIFIGVVLVGGSDDDNTMSVLIHLNCMLLIIVIFKHTISSMTFWEIRLELKTSQNSIGNGWLQACVDEKFDIFDGFHGHDEIFYFLKGEHRFITISYSKHFFHNHCKHIGFLIQVDGDIILMSLIPKTKQKILHLQSYDNFLFRNC